MAARPLSFEVHRAIIERPMDEDDASRTPDRSPRQLFEQYHGRVHAFFRSRRFSDDEASDLTQETLVRVIQNMDALRTRTLVDAWVFRVAANIWKNELRYRQAGKRAGQELSLEAELESGRELFEPAGLGWGPPPQDPLDQALAAEHHSTVEGCLGELPPRMRRCLVLHVFQDHKYQQVADLLRLSIQSVKSHIHQARQHLRDCVDRKLGGDPA
ncbi:MAG: RNA polymerase sigma factor [Acidobacteriota bacterium]|nr:RNA polymerase sigma factor [Acidobacteriota bacterium]